MVFDWSGLIPRHPGQVMREQDLRVGEVYACVCTWPGSPSQINVKEFVFIGTYSGGGPTPPDGTESNIIDRIRDKGWLHMRCVSLHADGWVDDRCTKVDSPTVAFWANGKLRGLHFADIMFGLRDASDNMHSIVVLQADWRSNPVVAHADCSTPDNARCPDCKGTGMITLLTSSVPCGCREERA